MLWIASRSRLMPRLRLTDDVRDPDRIPFPGRRDDRRPDWRFDGHEVEPSDAVLEAERALRYAQSSLDELRELSEGLDDDPPPAA